MKRDTIRDITHVPHGGTPDRGVLDFSANINPVIPEGTTEEFSATLAAARSYPPEPPFSFIDAAATYIGVKQPHIIPTAGGLAGIRLSLETIVSPGDRILIPYPSFSEYEREAKLQGCTIDFVPYDEILTQDPASYAACIVCNPNNPTGETYDPDALRAFAEQCADNETVLLVDEAFLGFTTQPSLGVTPNTIVIRSLTKLFGLPGVRAGFVIAPEPYNQWLSNARRPWNLGSAAITIGSHVMRQPGFISTTIDRVTSERNRLSSELSSTYVVNPSDAPFLLLEPKTTTVDHIIDTCRAHGIAIRDARTFRGLDSHFRIAIRRPEENDQLLAALSDV